MTFAKAWHGLVEHVGFGGVGGDVIIDELLPLVVAGAEETLPEDEDDTGDDGEDTGEDTSDDDTLAGDVVAAGTLE